MTKNNQGRNDGGRTGQKTSDGRNPSGIHSRIKAAIVRLALWGLIPEALATWFIQRGGLEDA